MFGKDNDLANKLEFCLIFTRLPEESLSNQYVYAASPGNNCDNMSGVSMSKSSVARAPSYCFFRGGSSGSCQGQNFTGSGQVD